jgi:hypothetical protein
MFRDDLGQFRLGEVAGLRGLTVADLSHLPKPVIDFQGVWWEILTCQRSYVIFLKAARHVFADQILTR